MFNRLNLYKVLCSVEGIAGALMVVVVVFFDPPLALVLAAIWLLVMLYVLYRAGKISRDNEKYLCVLREALESTKTDTISSFPMATLIARKDGEIVWANDLCQEQLLGGKEALCSNVFSIVERIDKEKATAPQGQSVEIGGRNYTLFVARSSRMDETLYIHYFVDDHELKSNSAEYFASRPWVMVMLVDNYSDLFADTKENERSKATGDLESILENFAEENKGLLKKLDKDSYMAIVEDRYMQRIVSGRFALLDKIRNIEVNGQQMTVSIGVSQREGNLHDSELLARQALDMALGRGGDQAALLVKDTYEFYGGLSKGIEKRNKVRTRIVANAITEVVRASSKVFVMGHNYSDLDSLGACVGLCEAMRSMGHDTKIVFDFEQSLAGDLYRKMSAAGWEDRFLKPEDALARITSDTLLFIVDTHVRSLLISPEVFDACKNVIVIDHHRKMVNHIEKALIFFHEPYASSACEMVAELIQYLDSGKKRKISVLAAEALLAGIVLDTKRFTLRAGVRTFEAAAYLRRMGADTIEVVDLFASSREAYRKKAELVASAEIYDGCALAKTAQISTSNRLLASQAADELLSIRDVVASFVLFPENNGISISARSFGRMNVQLVMEQLGGGGHLTMAAAQLADLTLEQAVVKLHEAIDLYNINTNKDKGEKQT